MKLTKALAFLMFVAGFALALPAPAAPELDPSGTVSIGMLLGGLLLVIRANRKK
jgi:hypothetical protein